MLVLRIYSERLLFYSRHPAVSLHRYILLYIDSFDDVYIHHPVRHPDIYMCQPVQNTIRSIY